MGGEKGGTRFKVQNAKCKMQKKKTQFDKSGEVFFGLL